MKYLKDIINNINLDKLEQIKIRNFSKKDKKIKNDTNHIKSFDGLRAIADYEIGRASVGKECRSRWSPYH